GTLAVNLAGSFLIGLVQQLATEALVLGEETRPFLTTGVMGGLTTYSAFSYETVRLFEMGAAWQGWLNVVVTTAACLALCFLGLTTGRMLLAPRGGSGTGEREREGGALALAQGDCHPQLLEVLLQRLA